MQVKDAWSGGVVHVVLAPGKLDSSVEKKLFTEVMVPAFKRATDEEVQAKKEAAQIRADLLSCSEDDDESSSCSGSDADEAAAAHVLHYGEDGADEAAPEPASPQVEQDEGAASLATNRTRRGHSTPMSLCPERCTHGTVRSRRVSCSRN